MPTSEKVFNFASTLYTDLADTNPVVADSSCLWESRPASYMRNKNVKKKQSVPRKHQQAGQPKHEASHHKTNSRGWMFF